MRRVSFNQDKLMHFAIEEFPTTRLCEMKGCCGVVKFMVTFVSSNDNFTAIIFDIR